VELDEFGSVLHISYLLFLSLLYRKHCVVFFFKFSQLGGGHCGCLFLCSDSRLVDDDLGFLRSIAFLLSLSILDSFVGEDLSDGQRVNYYLAAKLRVEGNIQDFIVAEGFLVGVVEVEAI
jgi:hypothetical protein